MKKSAYAILVCSTFLISLPSVALSRGVNINFVNDGKGVDMYALQSTRKIIGSAIAEGVVDTFMITPLKADAATPPKKGFSACIEAGVGGTPNAFDSLVKRLKFVHPKGRDNNLRRSDRKLQNSISAAHTHESGN